MVVICPNYLRQMNLSPDEAEWGRERNKEREIERRENGSVHFKVNQYS